MTSNIKLWSATPGDNDAAPPLGAPEGSCLISDLNDISREMMASTRQWYDTADFRDLGHTIVTSASLSQVTLEGDVQSLYSVGMPVRWNDAGGDNNYGYITLIELVSTDTVITLEQTNDADPSNPITEPITPDVTEFVVGINTTLYDTQYQAPVATAVGAFVSGGAGNTENLPSGWVYEKTGEGRYTLTHNIGDRNYIPILSVEASGGRTIGYDDKLDNSFTIHIRDTSNVYDSQGHSIVVMRF